MVYITGDIHGGIDIAKLSTKRLRKRGIELNENDYVIILGDFGLPFTNKEAEQVSGEFKFWIKWLNQKPCTFLWIDGNHENFDYWDKQPVTEWHGGRVQVHPEASNVIHLMRGEIYEIEGKKYFAFGGAASHDKEEAGRKEGVSWWKQEEASPEEIANAERNLNACERRVDYILSHTPPTCVASRAVNYAVPDKTADYLADVGKTTFFLIWFCGHVHVDMVLGISKTILCYNSVINIDVAESYFHTFR